MYVFEIHIAYFEKVQFFLQYLYISVGRSAENLLWQHFVGKPWLSPPPPNKTLILYQVSDSYDNAVVIRNYLQIWQKTNVYVEIYTNSLPPSILFTEFIPTEIYISLVNYHPFQLCCLGEAPIFLERRATFPFTQNSIFGYIMGTKPQNPQQFITSV